MKKVWAVWTLLLVVGLFCAVAKATTTVAVTPPTATVYTQGQQQFTATVTGTTNQIVTWGISGAGCLGTACGSISSTGLYTAPSGVPHPPTVTVSAYSIVDGTQGTAIATIQARPTISVVVTPTTATVPVNGQQQFTATVTGTDNTSVTWRVSGTGCYGTTCGTISSTGLYSAPATVPNPSIATVTATSVADPSKSASATVVIQLASGVTVSISPTSAQVLTNGQQQFTATVTGSGDTSVRWSLSGAGCSGASCGTITTQGLYTAPSVVPNPPNVSVRATSNADPTKSATAIVTVVSGPSVTVSPATAQVQTGGQQQFTATVHGNNNQTVIWSVSGSGCTGLACGSVNSSGLYTAPSSVPSPPTVMVIATSLADPHLWGSATVTITGRSNISVSVSPSNPTIGTGAQQQFTATVTGTNDTRVTWSISGIGCYQDTCGTIAQTGLYTAPLNVPNPSYFNIVAKSQADPTKSGSATVVIVAEVTVTISPTTATVQTNRQQQFSATVNGTTNHGVTWQVSGAGCGGAGCGTVTGNGLYTAPASVPSPPTVNVIAISQADPSKSATAVVTVVPTIVVTVSPPTINVTVGGTQQFQASVSGTSNQAVTWTVQGTGCSGASCGTIDVSGLYTAPSTIPSPPVVTVVATSQVDNTSYGTAAVTITPTGNSRLNGQYAFLFRGHDQFGTYQAAGSFKADGQGHITWGLEDINASLGPSTSVAFTGTYQINGDSRGTMRITSSLGSHTYALAVDSLGKNGRMIVLDSTGIRGTAVFKQQDPSAFSTDALTGGYAISLSGLDLGGGRIAALGVVLPSGSGFVSGSSLDVNDAGMVYDTFGPFSGSYNVDPSSRGTMSLSILGLGSGTLNFAFYVVSANELLLVSIDPLMYNQFIVGGFAEAQVGFPYSVEAFNGHSVFQMTGFGNFPEVRLGRITWNGAGDAMIGCDENSGGRIAINAAYSGAYTVQLNGRGVLNLVDQSNGGRMIWYMYAYAPNQAFLMEASSSNAGIGELKPQLSNPPFDNSYVVGNYLFGSAEAADASAPVFSGTTYFDGSSSHNGRGLVSGTLDESTVSAILPNQSMVGTYALSRTAGNGRGSITLTSPAGNYTLWVISGSEFWVINTDVSNPEPTVWNFLLE